MPIGELRLAFDPQGLRILNGALGLPMFGIASDLSLGDFARLAKNPRAPVVGLLCQFVLLLRPPDFGAPCAY